MRLNWKDSKSFQKKLLLSAKYKIAGVFSLENINIFAFIVFIIEKI